MKLIFYNQFLIILLSIYTVSMYILSEGGLGQQRYDGGGCASMRERSERMESPGTYETG